jgi:hypothetical protein
MIFKQFVGKNLNYKKLNITEFIPERTEGMEYFLSGVHNNHFDIVEIPKSRGLVTIVDEFGVEFNQFNQTQIDGIFNVLVKSK